MREILFRGKALYDGTKHKKGDFLFGDLNHIYGKVYIFDRGNGSVDGTDCYEVDKESVGQFTGYKDVNNRKVFEGDFIRSLNEQIECAFVEFHDAAFFCNYNQTQEEIEHWGHGDTEIFHWMANRIAIEIIGNIFDNFELLK